MNAHHRGFHRDTVAAVHSTLKAINVGNTTSCNVVVTKYGVVLCILRGYYIDVGILHMVWDS